MVDTDQNKNNYESTESEFENVSIPLMLGDVIKIASPLNEILNDQTFFIDFINSKRVKLINSSTLESTIIPIQDDNSFGDGSIKDISLIYRNKEKGYARQNKLLPGTWINIYFGGDIPTVVTGQITDLEEDMIEIKSYPEDELLYINFNYSGIPDDLPIELIEIRKAPDSLKRKESEQDKKETETEIGDMAYMEDDFEGEIEQIDDHDEEDEETQMVPVENVREQIEKMILQADDVVFGFGEEFAPLEQYVEKKTANVRYSIEAQCNDLLDELLSTIPNSQRTRRVLTNIHTIIERFKQLRTKFSNLDKYGNVLSAFKKESDWKPLTKTLHDFNNKLYWLLPVAENVKKVYNVTGEIEELPNDIISLNTFEELATMEGELELYKSNSFPDGQNKYTHLIKNLHNEQRPFLEDNVEKLSNVLYINSVNTNLNVIIDNLGSLYSTVIDNNNINSKRFVLQKYNLGMKTILASKLDKSSMTYKLGDLTNNDTISLRSILTLPEPVVRFSHINLPDTNILNRSNLNENFIQYWCLLNSLSRVKTIYVDKKSDIFDEKSFLSDIKNFTLKKDDDSPEEIDLAEQYKSFVNKIIPTTRNLFHMTKKYMRNQVSLNDVVKSLEPFLVYSDDLTYTQYDEINKFILEEITRRISKYVDRSHAFFKLTSIKNKVGLNPSADAVYKAPNKLTKTVFNDGYDYKGENQLTNSELLVKILFRDAGRLYNSAISFENLALMYPNEIAKLFENTDATNKELLEEFSKKNDCQTYHIAKQYLSIEDVEQDNNHEIYYDKKFDKTVYSILDEYEKDMATKEPDEFIDFLVKKLEKTKKLNTEDAVYLAETLISGMKIVKEGDYAFFFDINTGGEEAKITYFKRVNNVWVEDESVDKSMFLNDNDILCNIHNSCVQVKDKCETTDMNKTQLEGEDLKNIMKEFDQKYTLSKDEMEFKIREEFEFAESTIEKLTKIRLKNVFKYNEQQVKIGSSLNETDGFNVVTSPNMDGLNRILGQGDFVKKQNDIIRFTMQFTRKAYVGSDESPFWRYCIKTGAPLMPEFRYTLASAFVDNPDTYQLAVERVKATIGKISDDGNAWVDEHSGQVIQIDNFEFEDVYVDGFKQVSRDILEKDAAQQIIGMISTSNKPKPTIEMKMSNNVIDAFASNMGINIEDFREFIMELAIRTFNTNLDSEEKYKKKVMKASKDNKTLPSYNEYFNARILYYTMSAFLIGVQTSVPAITTRRTFPGCVTSFKGFPFEGAGDDSGINYISCVAYNIRNSSDPWKVLKKKKQSSIAEALKRTIEEKFLNQPEVKQAFQRKADYLITSPSESIPDELNPVITWKGFVPPLYPFKVIKVSPLTTEFKSKLLSDLKSGYGGQLNDLLVVSSKIIHYSLAIQERIQQIVSKQAPILKNMTNDPFLENACCSTTSQSSNVLNYFINKDKEIEIYNNMVKQMGITLQDVAVITKGLLLYSPINTKMVYPPLKGEFSETTIYTAFIVYCKFNTILPIPENLTKFCNEKPENIQPSETMREMIAKLKMDGRNYDGSSLVQLFQIVSREHIVRVNYVLPTTDHIQCIRDILKKGDEIDETEDEENNDILDPEFKILLENNIETYSMVQEPDEYGSREFKNFLAKHNKETKEELSSFISQNTTFGQFNMTKIGRRFDGIFSFDEERQRTEPAISDSYGYNLIHTMKCFVDNFSKVYPNIILNEVDYDNAIIPTYMGLSGTHDRDLKNIIKDEFSSLKQFYSRKTLNTILKTIVDKSKKFVSLMKNIPYFCDIEYKEITKSSIFDQRLSFLLIEYFILTILKTYMNLTNDQNMIFVEEPTDDIIENSFTVESLDEDRTKSNVVLQIQNTDLLLEGNKKILKSNIADLLLVYLEILHRSTDIASVSYKNVMDTVFKLKEAEKRTFTDKLAKMTDEQRNVDTMMKVNKLGDWGKGLKSGITRYDAVLYDEEKETMENILRAEKDLIQSNENLMESNKEQYLMEQIEQQHVNEYIEEGAYDMSHMNEDYDDGDFYGDELEEQGIYD